MKNRFVSKAKEIFTGREGFWPIFLITMLIACMPLVTSNCIVGHDSVYHLLRIESLKKGIEAGLPFLRINMLFFGGEGYASSLFYPDTLLYLPALLRVAGVGINKAYHIFIAFTIASCFLSAYFCMKTITKDRLSAVITAIVFSLCQYHMDDIYSRSAVGEFTALIFVPLVILGIWDFMYDDCKRPYILGFGMIGVILCHTLTTMFCIGLCMCGFVLRIKHMMKNPKIILKLVITAIAVVLMTAFYWMPVAEQLSAQALKVSKELYDVNYEKHKFLDIFLNRFASVGLAPLVMLLPAIWLKRDRHIVRFADMCAVMGILFCAATTGIFPWARMAKYLKFIQFPWRLNVIASPLLAVAAGIYIAEYIREAAKNDKKARQAAATAALAFMIFSAVSNISRINVEYYSYSNDYFDYAPFTTEVIGGEWLPVTVNNRSRLVNDAYVAYSDDDSKLEVTRDKNTLEVINLTGNEKYIDVPFIYYKGYVAEADGQRIEVASESGENGRVRIYPDGAKSVKVYYNGTIIQNISTALSVVTWLMIAAWLARGILAKQVLGKAGKRK
ncbi:MAG: hypothetical protein K6G84_08235 [Lachnospiraceae bacterium]|nr:hypothetical protein [Lachnospiraceae bacterium]